MKSDLSRLMAERNIDAYIILGTEHENTDRYYITNGVHASSTVVHKRGEDPVLIVSGMEIDEAKKSGHTVMNIFDFGYADVLKAHRGNPFKIQQEYFRNVLNHFGIMGRLALYGTGSVMSIYKIVNRLNEFDFVKLVEDQHPDIFTVARRTKDAAELEALRESGRRSSLAMTQTREWLATMRADGENVVNADGQPVTIGDVKRFVRLKLMELDMEDSEGMIFAQGRDAGVPHSRGEAEEALKVGQAIVFDLFPRPIGGGYYHDMTRTWSLGHATPDVEEAHRLVMHAFTQSLEALSPGQQTRELQDLVCDIFEEHGHKTPKSEPGTQEGYVHSLGHGLGLNVHEAPSISNYSPEHIVFEVGDVVTIEPGLYYPERGWGIRIEDTVYIDENGELINLTDTTYDLVVPLQG
jgi:Xaa-Pro aminopeptidase